MSSLISYIAERTQQIEESDLSRFKAPENVDLRKGAILLLFAETEQGLDLTFIERSRTLRNHAGQVAFPGGMVESQDKNEIATALREAKEEIALETNSVEVIGTLPNLFVPVSQIEVTPVIAHWHSPHDVYPNDLTEVARVERIAIAELVNPKNRVSVRHNSGFVGPAFNVKDFVIWGFTGGLLDGLLTAYGFEEEWNAENIVELDPRYS